MRDNPHQADPTVSLFTYTGERADKKPQVAWKSACRTAADLYLAELGSDWPTEANVERFNRMAKRRFNDARYGSAVLAVIVGWKAWLDDKGIWCEGAPPKATCDDGLAVVINRSSPSSVASIDSMELSARSLKAIAETVRETIFGGEPSDDYWGAVMRRVGTALGSDGLSAVLKLDRHNTQAIIAGRKVPKHVRADVEKLHALLVLRKSGLDPDEVRDQLYGLEAHIKDD